MRETHRSDFATTAAPGLAAQGGDDMPASGPPPPSSAALLDYNFAVSGEEMGKILEVALSKGGDFSELFFEYRVANSITMEDDIIRETSENVSLGAGIRVISGEKTGYGYTSDLSFEKMRQTALTAASIAAKSGAQAAVPLVESTPPAQVYDMQQPFSMMLLGKKLELVKEAYAAAQKYDSRISKVQAMLADGIRHITIANSEGLLVSDARPQVRLMVVALAEQNGLRNSGFYSGGGRVGLGYFQDERTPQQIGTRAAEEAILLLAAADARAGEQPVVLGIGQSGVMIHEAVGHSLEADGNRKGTSIMASRLGKMVATPAVTIYDDATIPRARGSMNIDDEGTATQKSVLIEKGRLVGYIQDRLSAKLMGMKMTGNGRRQNFQHYPVPRMTNTVLAQGEYEAEEIIRSVKKGFYAKSYQGGEVEDSGKFVFSVNLGYMIEDGQLTRPVKNATLIGTNVQILNSICMVGNDMGFFLGTCGKEGQSAAVSAGTPTMKIERMTVGGRK